MKLWHLYDATDYAANLFNCPLVAYSGEIDGQLMYGRIVLIVPRLTGDRIGVILNMGTVPSVAVDYSPDQVGSADLLEIPLRSFRFGA